MAHEVPPEHPLRTPNADLAMKVAPELLFLALFAVPTAAQDLFDAPIYVTGSTGGEFRGHGDFDGDGDPDLLHMTGWLDWTGMTVFFNQGGGKFTAGPELVFTAPPGTDVAEFDPAIGDFNGDGFADVGVGYNDFSTNDEFVVFFGDGAGGFPTNASLGLSFPSLTATGNIDGDAADEIALIDNGTAFDRTLRWIDWNGVSLVSSTPLLVDGSEPDPDGGAFVFGTGDFDSDGDDDVVATNLAHNKVRIFPTVAGNPTFSAQVFPVISEMDDINHRVRGADLDGDGDDDIVHLKMNTGDPGPWVQTYENVSGVLVQRPAENVPRPTAGWIQPHNLRVGDLNGDGWMELFANAGVTALDVVVSDADWTFSEGFEARGSGQSVGGGPADFTGDGNLDFAGTRTIFVGDGTLNHSTTSTSGLLMTFADEPYIFDFEGDGDLDLMGASAGAGQTNDGTGTFATTGTLFESPGFGFNWGFPSAFGDFNGDGRRDFLTALFGSGSDFLGMHLLVDDGIGKYVDAGLASGTPTAIPGPGFGDSGYWDTADADSDGDLDMLVEDGYWENTGSGFLSGFVPAWNGRARDGADVNGDTDIDLIATRDVGASTLVFLIENTGTGYQEHNLITAPGDLEAVFHDLDGDGDPDVMAADPDGNDIFLFENVGGALVNAGLYEGIGKQIRAPGVEDFDGDGKLDLLTMRFEDNGFPFNLTVLTVLRRTGPGLVYEVMEEYFPAATLDGFLDQDGDGDLDGYGKFGGLLGLRVKAPDGGVTRQFKPGFPGTGGVEPIIGALGPATSTNPNGELRIVRGVGGGLLFTLFGPTEVDLPDVPFPGMSLYVGSPTILSPVPMGGTPGAPGEGSFAYSLPTLPGLFGLSFTHQAFVLDPGSSTGVSASNGLEIVYGQ